MPELTPDNIDALFRQGTEQGAFPFREDAWDDLDRRLDRRATRVRAGYWARALLLLLALLGGVWWWHTTAPSAADLTNRQDGATAQQTSQELPDEQASKVAPVPPQTPPAEAAAAGATVAPTNERSASTAIATTTATTATTVTTTEPNASTTSPAGSADRSSGPMRYTATPPPTRPGERGQEAGATPVAVRAGFNTDASASKSEIVPTRAAYAPLTAIAVPAPGQLSAVVTEDAPTAVERIAEAQLEGALAGIEPLQRRRNRGTFALTVSGSVESSGTGSPFRYQRRGYTFGAQIEYLFARRFGVDAGLLYTHRKYTTEGSNYQARPGFWVDGIAPTMVDGDLSIVEIPVQFRTYTRGYRSNGFFAGAGLSTYLVEREWYDYTYENPTEASMLGWGQEGVCRHFFGIANFTAGYQWRTSDRTMMRLAPYYNLPLMGIGDGKMAMQSAGLRLEMSLLGR